MSAGDDRSADALGLEPRTGDSRSVQRPDRAGARPQSPGFSRHVRAGPRRHLGVLADRPPAQPARSGHPPAESRASPTTMWPPCSQTGTGRGVACGVVTDGPDPVSICTAAGAIERSRPRSRSSTRSARATRSWPAWSTAGSSSSSPSRCSVTPSAARSPTPWSGTRAPIEPVEVRREHGERARGRMSQSSCKPVDGKRSAICFRSAAVFDLPCSAFKISISSRISLSKSFICSCLAWLRSGCLFDRRCIAFISRRLRPDRSFSDLLSVLRSSISSFISDNDSSPRSAFSAFCMIGDGSASPGRIVPHRSSDSVDVM